MMGRVEPIRPERAMASVRVAAALSLGAGVVMALAMPPWGFWPLALVAVALLEIAIGDPSCARRRLIIGGAFGLGWISVGIGWMWHLTAPGYLFATALFSLMYGIAAAITPSGPWRIIARPAALALAEAVRFSFPFGGVPLAGVALSQVGGPLVGAVRIVGPIGLAWVVFQIGTSVGSPITAWLTRNITPTDTARSTAAARTSLIVAAGGALASLFVVTAALGAAPRGVESGSSMRIAAVQGGGEQGTSALEVPTWLVTERHLVATEGIDPGLDLDLVLWPENAIRVRNGDFTEAQIAQDLADQASRIGAPIAVGITEDMPPSGSTRRFTNAQVVVMPDGEIASRYDKVRRVPFGEYVPWRGTLEALGLPLDQIPSDAVPGSAPAVLSVPDSDQSQQPATIGVAISWEVFFSDRLRDAIVNGGEILVNPTNGASYTGTILQTQQVASSRLRAVETGRWVVQASPTGFTAFVSPDGTVVQRSGVSEQVVLVNEVTRRTGLTWYMRAGDGPVVAALALLLAVVIATTALRSTRSMKPVTVATPAPQER
jgi:apolipoprotein N-acyltransferase